MRIGRATTSAQVEAAADLFDGPPLPEATAAFLAAAGHHLLIAWVDDSAVGFVSGVETVHPDKGSEMFLYELAVAESHRRQGIGTALVRALAELARTRRCYGMWVGVDVDNEIAVATYRRAGATEDERFRLLGWSFR